MKAIMIRLALASALAISAAPAVFAQDAVTERLDDRKQFKDGAATWDKVCARCHTTVDDKTEQSVGPNLSLVEYDIDTLRHFVRNGHLAMPAFPESAIDEASLVELADHIAKNVYKGDAE